jgi:uncharacterized protein involved in tolerance to divalent cations
VPFVVLGERSAVRTSVEDEVIHSGQLSAFSRHLGLDDYAGLGRLTFVWKDTQRSNFHVGDRSRLKQLLAVRFGRAHADQIIDALIDSMLAEIKEEKITICGNKKHIDRVRDLKAKSSKGGQKRAKNVSRRKDGTFHPAQVQADIQLSPSGHPGVSSAITITNTYKEEYNNILYKDPTALPEKPNTTILASLGQPAAPAEKKPLSAVFQLRDKFLACYAELYHGAIYEWNHARDGKQAKLLLVNTSQERVMAIMSDIDAYFGWRDPLVIKNGHTFSNGFWSFVSSRHRLHADMAAPERHEAAAIIAQERYEAGKSAFKQKQEQLWAAEHSETSLAAINPQALAALPSRRSVDSSDS